jgi:hypothetical protein
MGGSGSSGGIGEALSEDFEEYVAEGNFHEIDVLAMLESTERLMKR